jgi:hypothetical protein
MLAQYRGSNATSNNAATGGLKKTNAGSENENSKKDTNSNECRALAFGY